MHFATSLMALVASAALSSAAHLTIWTLDDVQRTVYFTHNPHHPDVDPVAVNSNKKTTIYLPDDWQGNFYSVKDGETNDPNHATLGELTFNPDGTTFFDVSAIVGVNDHDNVKQIFPAFIHTPVSGCEVFPCNDAYYHADDVQTKATDSNHLSVTLGTGSTGFY